MYAAIAALRSTSQKPALPDWTIVDAAVTSPPAVVVLRPLEPVSSPVAGLGPGRHR